MVILETLLAGGATGLLGSVFSKTLGLITDFREAKERKEKRDHELKLLDRQLQARKEETESEAMITMYESDGELREASYEHDTNIGQPSQWVVDILKLSRLLLTLLLIGLIGVLIFKSVVSIGSIVDAVIYCTTSAITWWFGDRAMNKSRKNHV